MARFYADEDFPRQVVQMLRDLGHDVLTVQQAGRTGSDDSEVLADATTDGRAVLTHNHRHYSRMHSRQTHAGIISCTRDKDDLPSLAQRIHDCITSAPKLANQFIRIIRPNPAANIQEKIHPQAIIDALPRIERESDRQLDRFADFNGLPAEFEQRVDFYRHDGHWSNRMILGDSLLVMTSLAEKE